MSSGGVRRQVAQTTGLVDERSARDFGASRKSRRLATVLGELADVVGPIDRASIEIVREGHNLTFVVPEADLFVRVGERGSERQAAQSLEFARRYADHGLPILAPDPRFSAPIPTAGGPVTIWPLLSGQTAESDPDACSHWQWAGRSLRDLHTCPKLVEFRSAVTSGTTLRDRCAVLEGSPHSTPALMARVRALIGRVEHLSDQMQRTRSQAPVHGDPYPSNVMVVGDQRIFIDLDNAGLGIPAMDAAIPVVLHRRFGLDDYALAAFFDGYGDGYDAILAIDDAVRLRELGTVTYLIALAAGHPVYADELMMRLDTLNERVHWTKLPELAAKAAAGVEARTWQARCLGD